MFLSHFLSECLHQCPAILLVVACVYTYVSWSVVFTLSLSLWIIVCMKVRLYVHVLFSVSLFLSACLYNLTDSVSSYIITNCMSLYMYVSWSVFLAFFFTESARNVYIKVRLLGVQWSWFARVNALCNLSRKKSREVAASLPAPFLSRRSFMLCIRMEVEPRIAAKQYWQMPPILQLQNYRGKAMEGGKKKWICVVFWLTKRSRFRGEKKMRFGASYSTSNKLLLVARHILTAGLQKCL